MIHASGGSASSDHAHPARRSRVAAGSSSLMAWPGQELRLRVSTDAPRAGAPSGTRIGTLTASIGPEQVDVPVVATGSLGTPSLSWRLRQH